MLNLKHRITNLLRLAVSTLSTDDSGAYPKQQVSFLGKTADAVSWLPYGFHANVPGNELQLLLSLQGREEQRIALPTSADKRPRLQPTEVVVFHPETGSKITFAANGDINIVTTVGQNVTVTTPAAAVVSPVVRLGESTMRQLVDERILTWLSSHTHADPVSGTTGAPDQAGDLGTVADFATTDTEAS